jgi:hypothetical protein
MAPAAGKSTGWRELKEVRDSRLRQWLATGEWRAGYVDHRGEWHDLLDRFWAADPRAEKVFTTWDGKFVMADTTLETVVREHRYDVLVTPSAIQEPAVDATDPETRKRDSRNQQLIREEAARAFADGWANLENAVIIKELADRIKARGLKVPSRDTFLRALGRRKK